MECADNDVVNTGRALPELFHPNDMYRFVDNPIPLTRETSTACCLWMGPIGSYDVIPDRMKTSPFMLHKTNGKMRYNRGKKSYSPRNLNFAYCRPDEADLGPGERLRLVAWCKRPTCVNPWHMTRHKRRQAGRVYNPHIEERKPNNGIGSGQSTSQGKVPHYNFKVIQYLTPSRE